MLLAASAAQANGCSSGRTIPQSVQMPFEVGPPPARSAAATPEILSAHFAWSDARELGGRDGVAIVFSVEIDPSSVTPDALWVALESGERVRAEEAVLAPANEGDENRTIVVIGRFGAPDANPPVSVAVYGLVYAEDGRPLQGLAADVLPFREPGRIVTAERIEPAAGRCEGASAAIRTYWIDALRGVSVDDLQAVRVRLADGRTVVPDAFDDHVAGTQDAEDNVIDLCLRDATRPVHLSIAAATFEDPAAHPSAAIEVEITDAGATP